MNTVINQLVKEAAYHAAKYDSTVNAIRSIAQGSQMTKTAFAGLGEAGATLSELGNIVKDNIGSWGEAASDYISQSPTLQGLLGGVEGFGGSLRDATMTLPQGIGAGLAGAAGGGAIIANSMMNAAEKDIAANAAEYAKELAAQNLAHNNAINALKAQNADLFANAGERFQNAGDAALAKVKGLGGSISDMGAAAKNKLMGMGRGVINAAKAHPYTTAGVGLAGAGAAALPFLLGGEKEGSYDPYKLQVLRSVLSGM